MGPTHKRVGILGGTFDPVHVGHIALGRTAIDALQLEELLLLPSGQPWQKERVITSAEHRIKMLELALQQWPGASKKVRIDRSEIDRAGPSYTYDTLVALRKSMPPSTSLIWILGSDQFRNLPSWYRWNELLSICHLAVTQREHISLANLPLKVDTLLSEHGQQVLPDRPNGSIVLFSMPPVAVSSTALRRALQMHDDVTALMSPLVLEYVEQKRLYLS